MTADAMCILQTEKVLRGLNFDICWKFGHTIAIFTFHGIQIDVIIRLFAQYISERYWDRYPPAIHMYFTLYIYVCYIHML